MLQPEKSWLVIADISGYTSYLASVELDHAQDILADLIGTVVTALRPGFRLAKLEGDAAFVTASADTLDGSLLLDTIERCYFGFRRRRRDVRQATSCECNACVRIPDLNLKFVAHQGLVIRQRVAGSEELIGSDAIVVHRLLKNGVTEQLGIGAYALFTQAATDAMGIDPAALEMAPLVETYEHVGEVQIWVEDLERRWQEEESRQRVFVSPEESVSGSSIATGAAPQVVWEFLTVPGRRAAWQTGVTEVLVVDSPGNRRSVGAAIHCMHGADAIVEEILDWRPYDYWSNRTTINTPEGPMRMLNTVELEPTSSGTTVHIRYAAPKSAKERAIFMSRAAMYEEIFQQSAASFMSQLEAELAERQTDAVTEPDLPGRKADGILAGLAPDAPTGVS